MTAISPRVRQDRDDHFTRMHRQEDLAQLQRAISACLMAIAVTVMAAAAGYLAADQACFPATLSAQQSIETD